MGTDKVLCVWLEHRLEWSRAGYLSGSVQSRGVRVLGLYVSCGFGFYRRQRICLDEVTCLGAGVIMGQQEDSCVGKGLRGQVGWL